MKEEAVSIAEKIQSDVQSAIPLIEVFLCFHPERQSVAVHAKMQTESRKCFGASFEIKERELIDFGAEYYSILLSEKWREAVKRIEQGGEVVVACR